MNWRDYQDEVAKLFRNLGLSVETDRRIEGVRTTHDIDVVVRSKQAGIEQLWLVECKKWNRPISKDKVLILRTIVTEIGADRGFMMAESGYQTGTLEAAMSTNITLTSINELEATVSEQLGVVKLRSLLNRVESCRERYWAINKADRITLGLRPDVTALGYSGATVVNAVEIAAEFALRNGFPIKYDRHAATSLYAGDRSDLKVASDAEGAILDATELAAVLAVEISELENRLSRAEAMLGTRSDDKQCHRNTY